MSLPISPISSTGAAPDVTPASSTPRPASASPAAPADGADAVSVTAMPSSPPPEVLQAMATASAAYDRLAAAGQHLHFASDPTTGKLSVQVTDPDGNVLGTVSPTTVLDVASGDPLQ